LNFETYFEKENGSKPQFRLDIPSTAPNVILVSSIPAPITQFPMWTLCFNIRNEVTILFASQDIVTRTDMKRKERKHPKE
jgi:hypothetical protein